MQTASFRINYIQNGTNAAVINFPNAIGSLPNLYFRSNDTPDTYIPESERMVIMGGSGNVGIGTTVPKQLLHVNGQATFSGFVGIGTINPNAELHIKAIPNSNCDLVLENAYGHKWDLASNGNNHFSLYQPSTGLNRIEVTETGNVGIGTSEPQAKLQIEVVENTDKAFAISKGGVEQFLITGDGKFYGRAYRIKTGNFPDYVFSANYQRMPSFEKSNYIKCHKHLPYLPSAKEVESEGLDIGDGIIGIARNVEENVLDIQELFQRIKILEEENKKMKTEFIKNK